MTNVLALTMGEPAGIGGEITLGAWSARTPQSTPFVLIDDPERVRDLAAALGADVPVTPVDGPEAAEAVFHEALPVMALNQSVPLQLGVARPATAQAVLESITTAVALAQAGRVGGVVTNPIHKAALQSAGFSHPGHTEFLAALAGVPRTVMMLVGADLRVVPVTIHIPLADVPHRLTEAAIVETGLIVDAALRSDFGIAAPRIAVSGLNPHAGEDGTMGLEDRAIVAPAVAVLKARGIVADGPRSADTMFHQRARTTYDAALCMYHDQALIPIKTLAFDEGVNVTLGLPFIRTSPDHGTALDISGRGIARPDSLCAALHLAADLSARRQTRIAA
ncbi:MAG: 4-hydroxythreonine-4-phosphate dehydrogenase PdxA [Pseudomonadota bacterium]